MSEYTRGLPNNIKAEIKEAEIEAAIIKVNKEFPDSPRIRDLFRKQFYGQITKPEQVELCNLLEERNKKD